MPWLDTPRAGFMSALEHFWNRYASGRHKLMLIAAGSATAWMLDNLVNNNGGLYDRTSRDIHVHPFSLSETETYFQKRNVLMDRYDIAQSYMIVGGVPYYLSLFEKGKSLAQNIDAVFFERGQAFEDVCFSHQEQIKRALGIQGVHTEIYPWRFISEGVTPGAQIDMLIDRADRVVNVCEMKFVQGEFSIDKDYDEKLRNKIVAVTEQTGSRKNPHMTLVTTYGLKKGIYSGRFQKVVTLDDLFVF